MNYQDINSFEEPARIILRAGVPAETAVPATIGQSIRLSLKNRFSAAGRTVRILRDGMKDAH